MSHRDVSAEVKAIAVETLSGLKVLDRTEVGAITLSSTSAATQLPLNAALEIINAAIHETL